MIDLGPPKRHSETPQERLALWLTRHVDLPDKPDREQVDELIATLSNSSVPQTLDEIRSKREERRDRRELADALESFQRAADNLVQVWTTRDSLGGDEIDNYPDYLPSLDEAVPDFQAMEVKP